ncbi:hypothetical protein MIC448_910004 [Microbacterium sp. C448]|nr:hypothetical protein MIC448_910004 [Microbacterium sp. C448]
MGRWVDGFTIIAALAQMEHEIWCERVTDSISKWAAAKARTIVVVQHVLLSRGSDIHT